MLLQATWDVVSIELDDPVSYCRLSSFDNKVGSQAVKLDYQQMHTHTHTEWSNEVTWDKLAWISCYTERLRSTWVKMLITNCLSSKRIKNVINPGWEAFTLMYLSGPQTVSHTFLKSIIKKVIHPGLMLKPEVKKILKHDIIYDCIQVRHNLTWLCCVWH